MKYVTGLRCVICGELYQPDETRYVCPRHGNEGILDVEYDYTALAPELPPPGLTGSEPFSMFHYRALLPVDAQSSQPPLQVGGTPLYAAPRLAKQAGVARVWVKDDGRNPTGSLKDRASAVAVMKAAENGVDVITTASTGNAAAALAGLAASTGQKSVIFVPAAAPPAKIAQLLTYGATVMLVESSYDDAFELCLEATAEFGWYCRNTGYNPYMAEGKKSVSYELIDQLWQQSGAVNLTHVFVSVGDGCIISGVHKGFKDLVALGRVSQTPHIIGVQAERSAFLYDAWRHDEDVLHKAPVTADSLADSINAGLPRDRIKAMAAVRESDGAFIAVTDDEILAAIPALARDSGIFAEPAGAAAYAGLLKAARSPLLGPESRVGLIITGNGLKDVNAALQAAHSGQTNSGQAATIPPKLTAVKQALRRLQTQK